jgi:hypothetical protein
MTIIMTIIIIIIIIIIMTITITITIIIITGIKYHRLYDWRRGPSCDHQKGQDRAVRAHLIGVEGRGGKYTQHQMNT